MNARLSDSTTPAQRLQASRAHMRTVWFEAKKTPESVLQKMVSEHPVTLATLAALAGAALMALKPWRWKVLQGPLATWVGVALSTWLQRCTPKS